MKGMLALFLCLAFIGFASFSIGQDIDNTACQQTIQVNCTTCHQARRICHELDNKEANWPNIVKEMGEMGNLSQEVQDTVLNCLTKAADPKEFACKK